MATKFYLEQRADKSGEYAVRVSVSIKGVRLVSTTGLNIQRDKWDADGQRALRFESASGLTDKDVNARLRKIESLFADYEARASVKPSRSDLADVLAEARGSSRRRRPEASGDVEARSLLSYFDEFVRTESRAGQWTAGTLQCWNAFRRHLVNFGAADFADFGEVGLIRFVDYLRKADKTSGKAEMEEKTAQKHFSNLKWFLNWCVRRGYCAESAISKYRPKFKVIQKPVIFLTRDELMKLYRYQIPANGEAVTLTGMDGKEYTKIVHDAGALGRTRDLFCFCALTSLRYSDAVKLRRVDIADGCAYVTTKKTNDRLQIDLNSLALEILEKYAGVEFPGGLALPTISNQKMNDYIKDLGELCGFTEPITRVCYKGGHRVEVTQPKFELLGTHAGRRTFICFALSCGIAPQIVMKWTGHSDYKAMRPYIDIAASTKADAMRLFDESIK